ncbi:transglutaminase-like cysteine peptidase [Alsobacter metallidurans]|nr:transglutaminase-like cysteine peptidase [Alsobacter metallidurans]
MLMLVASQAPAEANPRSATGSPATRPLAMVVIGVAPAPKAFYPFCEKNPGECVVRGDAAAFRTTPERLAELEAVNREVNGTIRQVTDLEHFGVSDVWGFPDDGAGDCEDFALLKRRKLITLGWPSGRLLITAALDQNREGHAVLTAVTDGGDVVLDNKRDDIRNWRSTGYSFLTRQSQEVPSRWVFTAPPSEIQVALKRANTGVGARNMRAASGQR